jgi:SAM-dependent methyltransferase
MEAVRALKGIDMNPKSNNRSLSGMHRNDPAEFIEWDVRNWSKALNYWTAHSESKIANCSALEVGARNGGLTLWLALQGARVLCSDINPPGHIVRTRHNSRGVSHLIQYGSIDVTSIPYENEFDIIVFKSVLGAVGRQGGTDSQSRALSEIHKALKKGGELFFAENLIGSPVHQFLRRRFVPWGRSWRWVSISDMEKYMVPFSRVQYCMVGFLGALGRSEWQRNILGVLDRTFFNHVVPARWRYIIIGVAVK